MGELPKIQEHVQEALKPDDCSECGGGGGNDPSGEQGENPNCPTCDGCGKTAEFRKAYQQGQADERRAVVAHLRKGGTALHGNQREEPKTLGRMVIGLGSLLLGGILDGTADYFETGAHRNGEPTPREPLSDIETADRQGFTEGGEAAFWKAQCLRAVCRCVSRDCVRHGAYDPTEADRVRDAVRLEAEALASEER